MQKVAIDQCLPIAEAESTKYRVIYLLFSAQNPPKAAEKKNTFI